MDTLFYIGYILLLGGFVGLMINAYTDPPWKEIKYHLYSTIPGLLGVGLIILDIIKA